MPSLLVLTVFAATIPFSLALFLWLPARRALIATFLGAWLFLPQGIIAFQGLPDIDRRNAGTIAALFAMTITHWGWWQRLRWTWWDVGILVYCTSPFASSVSSGFGAYDGVSAAAKSLLNIGLPFFMARCTLRDLAGIRDLAVGIFLAALVYMPLCLLEVRFAPFLHQFVYRTSDHIGWGNIHRYGGFKPVVFLQGGVMLALFLSMATCVGAFLTRVQKRILGIRTGWMVLALFLTTVLCKSMGAIFLAVLGLALVFLLRRHQTLLPVLLLVLMIPCFLGARLTRVADLDRRASLLAPIFGEERVESLRFRVQNEDLLVSDSMNRFRFLGGSTNAPHLYDADGRKTTTIDSRWVIVLRYRGLLGLALFVVLALAPAIVLWRRLPPPLLSHDQVQPVLALTVITVLFTLDSLVNAAQGPLLPIVWGCLAIGAERGSSLYQSLLVRSGTALS